MRSLKGRCATGLGARLLLLFGECLLLLSVPDTRACFLWTFMRLPKIKSKGDMLFMVSKEGKFHKLSQQKFNLFINDHTV